ncbi:MAG: biopolymer transporter ExbD [Casimicrobium sp.]
MAFGTTEEIDDVMNEINMTPLVDVMLVLLIIFIITVPVMKHAVNIDLPRATNVAQSAKAETIRLSVNADGAYFWNEQQIEDAALPALLNKGAATNPQPDLHIRGDRAVRYERVAEAMAAAQQAGIKKIGFITEPKH